MELSPGKKKSRQCLISFKGGLENQLITVQAQREKVKQRKMNFKEKGLLFCSWLFLKEYFVEMQRDFSDI